MTTYITYLAILELAGFTGFAVISKVPNTLHTPLMSATNAIHGIVVVGGPLVVPDASSVLERMLAVIAIMFGSINVVGGFLVTDRMLAMFKPRTDRVTAETSPAALTSRRVPVRLWALGAAIIALPLLIVLGRWVSFVHDQAVVGVMYLVAVGLFIFGMSRLTGPRTAVLGNRIAAAGMGVAVAATLLARHVVNGLGTLVLIALGVTLGAVIGVVAARTVQMTAMPQMVALFNGVGGAAVALTAWMEFRHHFGGGYAPQVEIPSLFAALIGSISFWGSNIAFAKLQRLLRGSAIRLPGQRLIIGALFGAAILSVIVLSVGVHWEALFVLGVLVVPALLGMMVVLPIGGADMPVVISLLNALTGLSAAATGFALGNIAMIVAGLLVGASGTILTNQMAVAMNRSVPAIVAGGFGGVTVAPAGQAEGADRPVRRTTADDVAIRLAFASQVVIVPGFGMAVAQAQHAVRELQRALEAKGIVVKYAIHPVAGRMPGHMNVLLAEAEVPYELLRDMADINPEFPRTDVTLVIGANDVTNPDADRPGSPIHGMPILKVFESQQVIVIKRTMGPGFAGVDNPLFYDERTSMLFWRRQDVRQRDHGAGQRTLNRDVPTPDPCHPCAGPVSGQPCPEGGDIVSTALESAALARLHEGVAGANDRPAIAVAAASLSVVVGEWLEALRAAGAEPILLDRRKGEALKQLATVKALVITGVGADGPEDRHLAEERWAVEPRTLAPHLALDDWLFGVAVWALRREVRTLAAGLGMQALFALAAKVGDTPGQLVRDVGGHDGATLPIAEMKLGSRIAIAATSPYVAAGRSGASPEVICSHVQAPADPADGTKVRVTARTDDGLVHGFELGDPEDPWGEGYLFEVQSPDDPGLGKALLRRFVDAVKASQ
jgi:H+-translocating NAD(P) transhydrogenase subunit beta